MARIESAEKVRGYLELAIERFETALVFFSGDDAPQDLSYVYFEMGRTLMQLATINSPANVDLLEKTLIAFDKASDALNEDSGTQALFRLQSETALALSLLAQQKDRENAIVLLEKSASLYRSNIALIKDQNEALGLAIAYGNLGKDLTQLANLAA